MYINSSLFTYLNYVCILFLVEKASAELINITLQFNQSFKMDFDEKYSKCDLTKHIANDNKFKIKK